MAKDYTDEQLDIDVAHLTSKPEWQDEAKRPEFIGGVAARMRSEQVPAATQTKILGGLWDAHKGGWIKRGVDFAGRAVGEVVKSIPAGGGAAAMALGDATGVTDSGSGTRLKRGVVDLVDATGQRLKQLMPGESNQALRDKSLDALKSDLDEGAYPSGLERWLAGEHDDGSPPDAETQKYVHALTHGMAQKAVAADYKGKVNPEKVRAWLQSDRNPLFETSDTGGPGPRELLADYVATRNPDSWDAFKARVSETDSQRTTRLQRYANEEESRRVQAAMPEGMAKEMVQRSEDMQTSPIDLATMALPIFRGAKALKAVRGGGAAWLVAGKGMLAEGVQEAGTEYLSDPNASAGQVLEAGALGAVGQGAMSAGGAGVGYGLRKLQAENGISNDNVSQNQTAAAAATDQTNGAAAEAAAMGGVPGEAGAVNPERAGVPVLPSELGRAGSPYHVPEIGRGRNAPVTDGYDYGPVYHSSNTMFDAFDSRASTKEKTWGWGGGDHGFFGKGYYFTPDPQTQFGQHTAKTMLGLKKPLVIDAPPNFLFSDVYGASQLVLSHLPASIAKLAAGGLRAVAESEHVSGTLSDVAHEQMANWLTKAVKSAGYDGVVVNEEGRPREIVAFDPKQARILGWHTPGAERGSSGPEMERGRKVPVTGELLAQAHEMASRGSSTPMVPISSVFAAAQQLQPGLTPEAFMQQVKTGDEGGHVFLEPPERPETIHAAGPFMLRNALGVPATNMMMAPVDGAGGGVQGVGNEQAATDEQAGAPGQGDAIQRALDYLGANPGAVRGERATTGGDGAGGASSSAAEIAAAAGVPLLTPEDVQHLPGAEELPSGNEHDVFLMPDDGGKRHVLKVTLSNLGLRHGPRVLNMTTADYLKRWQISNEAFGSPAELVGMMQSPHGVHLVMRQPFVPAADAKAPHPVKNSREINRWLAAAGFEYESGAWVRKEDGVVLADEHEGNFIKTQDGLRPIDVVATRLPNAQGPVIPWAVTQQRLREAGLERMPESGMAKDFNFDAPDSTSSSNGGPGASSLNEWGKTTFGQRLRSDDRLRKSWRDTVGGNYRQETEAEWQYRANDFIEREGPEGAFALMTDPESGLADSDRVAIGLQLILHLDEQIKQTERAGGDIAALDDLLYETAEWIEHKGTKLGQAVRVFGMWTRMSAEGVLRTFERQVNEAREKDVGLKLGDPEKIADEVNTTAAEEREDVAAEALGETATDQLEELQRLVAELRQQLALANQEASAAQQEATQATTPADAAQAGKRALDAEKRRQRAQSELANAEARQAKKAKDAGKPRAPGQKKPRRVDAQALATRLIAQMERQQAANPSAQPAGQTTKNQVHQLAADYTAGRIDGPTLQAALQALGIDPDSAARLHELLDDAAAAAQAAAPKRQANELSRQAWEQIDRLTVRHSGGGLPTQQGKAGALQQLIREYLAAKPDALPDFNAKVRQLGLGAAEAVELQRLLDVERSARKALAEANAKEQEAAAFQRQVQGHIDRMTVRHSGGGLPDKPGRTSALSQIIRDYVKAPGGGMADFLDRAQQIGMQEKDAKELQRLLDLERKAIAVIANERAIARLIGQLTPKLATAKTRERMPRFLQKLMAAHELGALERPEFLKIYAEAFELPVMDDATRRRIKALIDAQKAAPEGFLKQEATTKLMSELAMFKGIKALDILTAYWYGNVLSGLTTQGVNVFGNAVHLLLKTLTVGASHNPVQTWHFIRGLYEGAKRGKAEAVNTLKTGMVPYKGDLHFGSGQTLELIHSDNPQTWGERFKNGIALGRFVFRALGAGDGFFYHTAKEGRAWLEAARYASTQTKVNGGAFADYLAEQLGNGITQAQNAEAQARAELGASKRVWSTRDLDRRTWEIMEATRPVDLNAKAARFGDLTTFTQEPEGTMGAIAGLINDAHKRLSIPSPWGPIRVLTPFIPFVNIVANVTSTALDFTPVGIVRGSLGRFTRHGLDRSQVDFDAWEARQRIASGMLGTLGAGLCWGWALALRDRDDDEVPFMIYGMGPGTKARRDQMPKGWRPFTVKVGDSYVSYAETPLSLVFAVAGNAMDYLRYNPKGKDEHALGAAAYALGTSPQALLKTGVLSSINDLFNLMEGQRSGTQVLTRTASGFIPGQGLLRDISELFHGDKIDDTTITSGLLKDVPVIRELVGKPALNIFGEPVKLDTLQRLPIMKRLATGQGEDAQTLWLARQKLWLPGLDNQIDVGTYLGKMDKEMTKQGEWRKARESKLGRAAAGVLTAEERYKLVELSGPGIRQAVREVQAIKESLPEAKRDQLQDRLNAKIVAHRREAMRQVLGFDGG